MAVVDRRGCDGCGRTLPIEELAAVSLPGDEQAVCCPECREHAESVAEESIAAETRIDRQRGECAGCGETHPVDAFETVGLPDGDTVAYCPDCAEHAASMSRRTSVDGHRGDCSGCGEAFDVNDLEVVELDDGETVACCETCAEYARAAARTTADEPDYDDADPSSTRSGVASRSASTTAGAAAAGETDANAGAASTGGATTTDGGTASADASTTHDDPHADGDASATVDETALSEDRAVCDQCGDWVDVELFEVVTVDERVEEFCPPCKDRARRNGVVTDVRMRRAEAYEVLGVAPERDEAVVRDVYLSQIKTVHPDCDDGSEEAFRRVQRAYERLTE